MLFRTYYQPLCNYAYTFVQDRDEAEEIVQSTFLNVWEKRDNLSIHTGVKPYLYAMVRNASLNVLKHEKIKQQHVTMEMAVAERSVESVTRTVMASELETTVENQMGKALKIMRDQLKDYLPLLIILMNGFLN